jgi:hypothetical protein
MTLTPSFPPSLLPSLPPADTIYAKAEVACDGRVCLWLGANVMLEYSYEEAVGVLETSLGNAREKLVRREGGREGGREGRVDVMRRGGGGARDQPGECKGEAGKFSLPPSLPPLPPLLEIDE